MNHKIVIVGDERQAIAEFAGADVDYFLGIKGRITLLNQSYRVPKEIHRLARKIEKHMKKTRGAVWYPRKREFNETLKLFSLADNIYIDQINSISSEDLNGLDIEAYAESMLQPVQ